MSDKISFTKTTLSALPLPTSGKRTHYRDLYQEGLILAVHPTGIKSFYVYKRVKGRPAYIFLGKFPTLSVEQARRAAQIKVGEIASGLDPQAEAQRVKGEATFGDLFDEYMERHSKVHKKSWRYDEREVKKFLSHWFSRRLSDIQQYEVRRLVEKIYVDNGLYQSNRILERVRSIYNKGIEWGWKGINPAIGIKKYRERSRDRYVEPHEMPCFVRSLNEEESQTFKDFFWTLLLVGARKTNSMHMRWEQIVWGAAEWRIPDSKNGDPLTLPLVEQVMDILKRRRRESASPWVFPHHSDPEKPVVNAKRAWLRIVKRATLYMWESDEVMAPIVKKARDDHLPFQPIESLFDAVVTDANKKRLSLPRDMMDIRIHDIRRTFGSYQAIAGASLQVIGRSLGHRSMQSTQVYARLNLAPVRASIEKAMQTMLGVAAKSEIQPGLTDSSRNP